jgi:hypothetical protein
MLKTYVDESSDHTANFLMGGWLADCREWEKFSDAWDQELKFAPSIRYFKHYEASSFEGEFGGWEKSSRDAKMEALAKVIAEYDLIGFISEVSIPRVETLFDGSILPKKTLKKTVKFIDSYHFACQGLIASVLGHQIVIAKNETDRIDFIFDDGVSYLDDCISNYPKLIESLPLPARAIAGTVIPGNDMKIIVLQAADMLVGQALFSLRKSPKPDTPQVINVEESPRLFRFNIPLDLPSVPKAMGLMNVVYATRRLDKIRKNRERIVQDGKTS